ncbi:MAG: cytochrome P450 [Pseudomonadota bacterium]
MRTLDINSPAFKASPHTFLADAQRDGPFVLCKMPLLGNVKAALTHSAVQSILKESDRFALDARNAGHQRAFGLPFIPQSLRLLSQNLLSLDDPDHQRLRRQADTPFRRAAIENGRDQVAALADRYLDEVAKRGATKVDLVSSLFRPLPLMVISNMLGLSDAARDRLTATMAGFSAASSTWGILRALGGMGKVIKQLRAEIQAMRDHPRPGLLSALIEAEADGGQMSEDELVSLVLVLFVAGHDTTTNLLSSGLHTLITVENAWQKAKTLDADGWRIAVDELMRFAMPVYLTKPRFVVNDTELAGVPFERGEKIMAILGAANLDPAVFDQPLVLDLQRRPNRHTGWGGGPHICLGLHLAKMEAELVLAKIVERWPNLELGAGVKWSKRIGTRGLDTMPVRLNGSP